jgi:threonine/homoserine/homoserine lactone efflux protein
MADRQVTPAQKRRLVLAMASLVVVFTIVGAVIGYRIANSHSQGVGCGFGGLFGAFAGLVVLWIVVGLLITRVDRRSERSDATQPDAAN